MQLPDLPIGAGLEAIVRALDDDRRAVVSAPPGAGKTTVVPLALLGAAWRGDNKIVILEPRRLATRAAARRMAGIAGQRVGELIGYQTRDERVIGPATRVEVLTEGVLTRRLQSDPELPGVAAVIFDEVHERNLTTDLGLALTLDVAATLRPDLRILAMSATADTARFARLLAGVGTDVAPVVEVAGRAHPVDIRWLPRQRQDRLESAVERAVVRALADNDGDVLVFLPGIGEIMRCRDRLVGVVVDTVDVRPLAGAVSAEEQDLALAPSPAGRRRVVLATDIAETSLTVEGVRVVVDSGLARAPRFDTATGMTRLTTVSISRDSADQRAGRAGRTEPGVAYRLWSKIEHGSRPAHRAAEIASVDLAGLALEVAVWGTPIEDLAFPDPPPARAWKEGLALLRTLGAVGDDGALTATGRTMVALPVHPRLARIVATAPSTTSCTLAVVIDERDALRGRVDELPADLALRVALVAGQTSDDRADRGALRRLAARAGDLARRAGVRFDLQSVDPDITGKLLLAGFPDRLAGRRRPGQFQLRTGTAAWLSDDDPLARADFVVAADLDGRRAGARIRLAAAIDAADIAALLDDVVEHRRLIWDADRDDLVQRVERRLDALALGEETRTPAPGDETVDALVSRVKATKLAVLAWTPAATQLRARVAFLRSTSGVDDSPWPDLGDRALLASLDTWLRPYLAGAVGRDDLQRLDLAMLLRAELPWPLGAELDTLAPPAWTLPNGRQVAIDYTADRPTASVRVQDVYGVTDHPRLARGTVPLTLALLSPADRPIQVTADLPGFWAGSWAAVRKDLAGRYPKHRWPADPAAEPPGRLKPR
ncbi:MAG: putative ATP-dependent helicase [Desertimonas sp.]|nr:putative ATP-dependent helicase [Desertimonas sp.]